MILTKDVFRKLYKRKKRIWLNGIIAKKALVIG